MYEGQVNGDHIEIKSQMPPSFRHLIKNIAIAIKITDLEITSDNR